jgi:chemotaxis protein CheD
VSRRDAAGTPPIVNVSIARWEVAESPTVLRTLLGSCVAIILHDRSSRVGGLAHVMLPDSKGRSDGAGKYADTALPALLDELGKLRGRPGRANLTAVLVGGASMFRSGGMADIGSQNLEASVRILEGLRIPIVGRDVGGTTGRNVTLETASGIVRVRIPGGPSYEVSRGPAGDAKE